MAGMNIDVTTTVRRGLGSGARGLCLVLLMMQLVFLASLTCTTGSASATPDDQYGAGDLPLSVSSYEPEDLMSEERLWRLFEEWALKHSRNYSAYEGEKQDRYQLFQQNLFYIHNHNSRRLIEGVRSSVGHSRGHMLGLNQFADLSLEEFKLKHLRRGFRSSLEAAARARKKIARELYASCDQAAALPKSVDWREKGAVTAVKDQGRCGSCWAFSTTGAIEGAHAIGTGELVSLSEQELVSCSKNNYGCNGGLMDSAFQWVLENGGINSEQEYPYVSGNGYARACNWHLKQGIVATIDSYEDVMPDDESALMCAVARQPVSVAINAGTRDFQLYSDGVFTGSCSDDPDDIDHAALVVGYGTADDGKDFWILKNSWSESWGMEGYIHILRGASSQHGTCGITSFPSYPVVNTQASLKSYVELPGDREPHLVFSM